MHSAVQEVLDKAKRHAEQAEVYRVQRRETPVSFEANRLKMLETKESSGMALRIVRGGRIGFSATNDAADVDGLVERAVELAEFGAAAKFDLPGPESYAGVPVYDPKIEDVSIEEMVRTGQTMIDALREQHDDLVCEAGVTRAVGAVEIANSNGGSAAYERSSYAVALHGTLVRGSDMLFVGDWASSTSPDVDPAAVIGRVVQQFERAKETSPAPAGKGKVMFSPRGVASALLQPLMTALNGRTVVQGASPLEGRLGEQMLDPRFSLVDDPTVPLRPGSSPADAEGVPTRRTALIEGGKPAAFLFDLQTAGQAGAASTGSASRALGSLPAPSSGVLFVGAGDVATADMIASIDDGVLVEQLLGAGQGNVLGGEFGGNVLLGYRIVNGEIAGRVKDTMISGNVYEALKDIAYLGGEAEWVGGSLSTPPICCDGVTVSSKQ